MNDIILQTNTKYYGRLELLDYIRVHGTHIRADSYYVRYRLVLKELNIPGTFTEKYVIHNPYLFITEIEVDLAEDKTGILKKTRLVAINTQTGNTTQLSSLANGFVYPLRIEDDKIIYTKQIRNSSAIHEMEQAIPEF